MTKDSEFWNSLKVTLIFTLELLFEVGIGFFSIFVEFRIVSQSYGNFVLLPVMLPPPLQLLCGTDDGAHPGVFNYLLQLVGLQLRNG